MKLRDYQEKAVRALMKRLPKHRRVVCVSPTGSGKTVIGVEVVRRMGGRVLWLAHRRELLAQAQRRIDAAGLTGVTVASIASRPSAKGYDLIVIDEAHRTEAKSYQDVIASAPKAMVLGLTATPERLDRKPLGDTYADMLIAETPTRLIALGHLAPVAVYGVPLEKARGMVDGVASKGDYALGELGRRLMRPTLMGDVLFECEKHAARKRTIVFAATRAHGKALAAKFAAMGRWTRYLDGATPERVRDDMLREFAKTRAAVIVNVDVLSEGYDCEGVECVAVCRPTKSRTRWLQYVGRAMRPGQSKRAIVLDHAGNVHRFHLPSEDVAWTLDGRAPAGGGEAPIKYCPVCDYMNHATAIKCANCGADLPRSEREAADESAELKLIEATEAKRKHVRESLEKLASERGYDADWVARCVEMMAA